MYGLDVDTLNVYVKSNGKPIGNPIWTRKGDQGDLWRHATLSVTSQSSFMVSLSLRVNSSNTLEFLLLEVSWENVVFESYHHRRKPKLN